MNSPQIESSKKSKTNQPNFFYICGLTGGPYFPIPAIIEQITINFPVANNILIGVKNSYEQRLAESQNLNIKYLPKVKLDLLSFKNAKLQEIVIDILKLILNVFKFGFSFCKCIVLLVKFRPILIYSTGSFLAVPMIWAAIICNKIKLTTTKIVIHQQDASPGLANKLTAKFADLLSCTFEFTKQNFPLFKTSELIPNPIIASNYNSSNVWKDKTLESFVKTRNIKPLLLIFGGGTGALAINNWVYGNIEKLLLNYKIIHLTGTLQTKTESNFEHPDYFSQKAVFEDMPTLMASSNIVICRAGLGSITELAFLNKLTFLVPIPSTHQVQNAELISQAQNNFHILDQDHTENWIEQIRDGRSNNIFENQKYNNDSLTFYFQKLLESLKLDQK
jgi:UDP-N-acetylglucosamine--N-acetylmuramyl-(pentapeptide) pyrophosphoryl-undecaprenol N-acetylglucosamine transferase